MRTPAVSIEVRSETITPVVRAVAGAAERVSRAQGVALFLSGKLVHLVRPLAEALARLHLGCPILIATGAGVLSERGEIERASAATALVWSLGRAELVTSGTDEEAEGPLSKLLGSKPLQAASAALILLRADRITPSSFAPLGDYGGQATLFGGGVMGTPGVIGIQADGGLSAGTAAALVFSDLAPPAVQSSPACRLLGPLLPITDAEGPTIRGIDGRPALEVLAACSRELADQPLVFTVLSDLAFEPDDYESGAVLPYLLIRGVQGIDPGRGSLRLTENVNTAKYVSFAARDPRASRSNLELTARRVQGLTQGAAPCFGFYIDCAARGAALYRQSNVDTKIIGERFHNLPMAGLMSAFELAPYRTSAALQLHTGVLAVFSAPS